MDEEDDITARLLRLAGPRPAAPPERAARVRTAVHREWRAETRRRTAHRQFQMGAALIATAATVVFAFRLLTPRDAAVPAATEAVASVERIDGDSPLTPGTRLRTGEWVDTGAGTRLALRLPGGTSVRLDTDARARLLSPAAIELVRGAVYVDTGDRSTGLEVRTPLGVAHDVGTQFEVRLTGASLRVRVRSGLVEMRSGDRTLSARPGTELTLTGGAAETRTIAPFGPEWQWTADLAPPFAIEGRPVSAFLEHLSREQGWTLRFADAQLARDASGIILHGSVDGLEPQDALAVALRTSGLTHRLQEGELVVSR